MQRAEILGTNHSSCASYCNKTCMDYSFVKPKYKENSKTHRKHRGKIIRLKKSREKKILHELCWSKAANSIRNEISSRNSSGIRLKSLSKLKKVTHRSREFNSVDISSDLMDLEDNVGKVLPLKHKRKRAYCSCCSCSALQAQSYYIKQRRHKYAKGYPYCEKRSSSVFSTIFKRNTGKNNKKILCLKAKTIKSDPCTCASEIKTTLKRHSGEIVVELRHWCQKLMLEQPSVGIKSLKKNSRNDISSKESTSGLTQSKVKRNKLNKKPTTKLEEKIRDFNEQFALSKNTLDNLPSKICTKTNKCIRTKYLSNVGIPTITDKKLKFKHSLIEQSSWRKFCSDLSLSRKSDSNIHSSLISIRYLKKTKKPIFSLRHIYDSKNCGHICSNKHVARIQSISCDFITNSKEKYSAINDRSFRKKIKIGRGTCHDNIQISAESNKISNFPPSITSYTENSKHIISKHNISKHLCKSRISYVKKNKIQELSQLNLRNDSMFNIDSPMQQNKLIGLQEKANATNIYNYLLFQTQSKPNIIGIEYPEKNTKNFSQTVSISNQNKDINTELCGILEDSAGIAIGTINQEPTTSSMKIDQMKTIPTATTPRFKPTKRKNNKPHPTKGNLLKYIESEGCYVVVSDESKNKNGFAFSYKMSNMEENYKEACDSLISLNCSISNSVSTPCYINSDNRSMIFLKSHSLADFLSNTYFFKQKSAIHSNINILPTRLKQLQKELACSNLLQGRQNRRKKYRRQLMSNPQTNLLLFNKQLCEMNISKIDNNLLTQFDCKKKLSMSNNDKTLNIRIGVPDVKKQNGIKNNFVKDSKKMLVTNITSRTFMVPTATLNSTPIKQTKPNKETNMMIEQYLKKQNLRPRPTKCFNLEFPNSKSGHLHDMKLQKRAIIAKNAEATKLPLGTNNYNPTTRDSFSLHDSQDVMNKAECKENKIKSILKRYLLKSKIHKTSKHDKVTQCTTYKSAIDTNKILYTNAQKIGFINSRSNMTTIQQSSGRKKRRTRTPQSNQKSYGYAMKSSIQYTHALKNKRLRSKVYGCNYNNQTFENVKKKGPIAKTKNGFLSYKSNSLDREVSKPRTTNTSKSELTANDSSVSNYCKTPKRHTQYSKNEYLIKSRKISPRSFGNSLIISRDKQDTNIYTVMPVLLPYECEPGICVPGECDPYECYKRIKKRQISQLSGTEKPTRRTFGSSASGPLYKATKSQAVTELPTKRHRRSKYAKQDTMIRDTKTSRYAKNDDYDSIVRVGSSISFNIEFYKSTGGVTPYDVSKPSEETQPHKAKVKTRKTVVRPSRQHKKIHMPKTPLRHHKLQIGETDTKGTGVSRLKKSLATVALQKNEQLSKGMTVSMERKLPIRKEIGISKEESLPLYKEVGVTTRRYTPVDEGIRIRRIKDTGTKPLRPPRMSASNMTCMDPKCRSTGVESMLYAPRKDIAVTTIKPQSHHRHARFLPKGITRFGSNVTLNVEFYKERVGNTGTGRSNFFYRSAVRKKGIATIETDKKDASVKWMPQVQNRHAYTKSIAGYNEECQAECSTTTGIGTGSGMGTFLKRCFCTLNFSRKRRVPQTREYSMESRPSINDKYVPTKTCDLNTCDTQVEGTKMADKASFVNNMIKRCFCTRKFFKNDSKLSKSKSKVLTINRVSVENAWNNACRRNRIILPSRPESCLSPTQCISRKDYKFVNFSDISQSIRIDYKNEKSNQRPSPNILHRKQNIKKIYKKEVPNSTIAINKYENCVRRELKSAMDTSNSRSNIFKTILQTLRIKFRKNKNSPISSKNINTAQTKIPLKPSKLNSHKMPSKSYNITNCQKTSLKLKENKRCYSYGRYLTKKLQKRNASVIGDITRDEVLCNRKYCYSSFQSGDELRKCYVNPICIDHYSSKHQYEKSENKFPYADYKIVQMALVHQNSKLKKKQDEIISKKEKIGVKSNKNEKQIQTVKEKSAVKNKKELENKKADKDTKEEDDKKSGKNKKEVQDKANKNIKENEDKQEDKNNKEVKNKKSLKNKKETGAIADKNNINLQEDKANTNKKEIQDRKSNKDKKGSEDKKNIKNKKEIRDKDEGGKKVADEKTDKDKNESGGKKADKNKKDEQEGKNKNTIDDKKASKKILKDGKVEEDKSEKEKNKKEKNKSGKKTKSVDTSGKDRAKPKSKPKKGTKEKNIKTCTCGSKVCHKELKKAKLERNLKREPCVCGGPVCTLESKKIPGHTCQCDMIMAERYRKEMQKKERDELHKRQEAECDAKKQKAKLLAEQKRKQKETLKRKRKKEDNKVAKKFKKLDDGTLVAESILDAVKITAGVGVTSIKGISRAIFNPKCTYYEMRRAFRQPDQTISQMQNAVTNNEISAAAKRIKNRTKSMESVKELKNKIESNPVANYIFNIRKPEKRVNVKKRKPVRKRVRQDFECSLLMGSLRRRPCLFVYNQCPWCYPQCLSFLYAWRQCVDIFLFILAVGVWSPFILAMETCRALMCCFFCTG